MDTVFTGQGINFTGNSISPVRAIPQSVTDAEHAEKVLSHLCGRIQELSARLEPVLIPMNRADGQSQTTTPEPARSPTGQKFERLRAMANSAIVDVEDILNRLDV